MPYGITDMFSGGGSTLLGKLMDQRGEKTIQERQVGEKNTQGYLLEEKNCFVFNLSTFSNNTFGGILALEDFFFLAIRVGQLYRQDTPQPPKEQFQPKENFRHYFTLTSAKVKSRVTDFEKPDNRLELGVLVKMPVRARTTKNIDYP
ncbi:hypothetical protein CEXT_139261 [Caerostris extrusa]|uniref:Uncharacterized protein n=1 Tax=Caerostris extrusa TaxID=172846 RepID=A0AAV4XR68_CAEEX|nr:hypothetical protein CEXT_139261 [Caerostris extrusa]